LASFKKEDLWWEDTHLYLQSDEEALEPNDDKPTIVVAENFQFLDDDSQEHAVRLDKDPHTTTAQLTDKYNLQDFLSRPVRIASVSVPVGANTNYRWNIWNDFLSNSATKRKLENFYLLRGNLHIKVVVNATPFLYGTYLASYLPLINANSNLDISQLSTTYVNNNDARALAYTQRQHFWIEFHKNQGGEMVVPFLYHKNWLNITSSTDVSNMGVFEIQALMAPRIATTNSSSVAYMTVYAWMDNVELEGQTNQLSLQSDEFATGTISRPASIIAGIGRRLSDVPVIGPFAKATNFAAGAVAKVASLFGFTNVPSIDDSVAFKNTPYFAFASAHISTPIDRLTLDPKNELTIDPTVVGSTNDDILAIRNLVTRECLIYCTEWTNSRVANDSLLNVNVNPMQLRGGNTTTTPTKAWILESPSALVGSFFNSWRGDLKFRLKVVCSKYHQGRLLISYDPRGTKTSLSDANLVQNVVMDIAKEDELTFIVPYMQPTAWQNTDTSGGEQIQPDNTEPTYTAGANNGRITITVLNPLTAPLSTADVRLFLFYAGTDSLEFANPCDNVTNYSSLIPQSEEIVLGEQKAEPDQRYDVNYGEDIRSLRLLLRRTNLFRRDYVSISSVGSYTASYLYRNLYPFQPGYTSAGMDTVVAIDGTTSVKGNIGAVTPYTRLAACCTGQRGGMNYSFNFLGKALERFSVARKVQSFNNYSATQASTVSQTTADSLINKDNYGLAGMSLTNKGTQASLQANIPFMSPFRFAFCHGAAKGQSGDGTDVNNMVIAMADTGTINGVCETYYSVGPDFTFINYVSTVPQYKYTLTQ